MPKTNPSVSAAPVAKPATGERQRPLITVLDVASGLPTNFMGEIESCRLVLWKYPKKVKGSPGYFVATRLVINPDDSDVNDGKPVVAYYKTADIISVGKDGSERPGLIPSMDGFDPAGGISLDDLRKLALDGEANQLEEGEEDLFSGIYLAYYDSAHPIKIPGSSPWVEFKDHSTKNGVPVDMFSEGDWSRLDGTRGFFERVERKERKIRDGEEPAQKKNFKDELLVMTQYEEPQAGATSTARKPAATSTAAPATSTAATPAASEPAETSHPLDDRLVTYVLGLLADAPDNKIAKSKLLQGIGKEFTGADMKPALQRVQSAAFLGAADQPWTYGEDGTVSLG